MLLKVALFFLFCQVGYGEVYESFTGRIITSRKYKEFEKAGIVAACTNDIPLPCDPRDWRRLDGSCNNLKFPQRGGFQTPLKRLLPPNFIQGDEPAKAVSGKEMPNPRELRRRALAEGKTVDAKHTQLVSYALTNLFDDIGSIHDSFNFLNETLYCCKEEGKSDHMCTPNVIPDDDGVHRWSGIRCMNLTRPKSYESYGCLRKQSGLNRIEFATSHMDLSFIYASELPVPQYRLNVSGMIMYDEADGTTWPPHAGPYQDNCFQNVASAGETRCFGPISPSIFPVQVMSVLIWRMHNRIASRLAELNPCWDDERLFQTAKDINIALSNQIIYYELAPLMLGKDALIKSGVLSTSKGHRETYDEDLIPGIYKEFIYVMRSFHTIQEGTVKLYDENYEVCDEIPMVNMSLRVGKMAIDDNMAKILRGSFLQAGASLDRIIDPDLAEIGLGGLQLATDLATSDLHKGRLYGLDRYVKYVKLLYGVHCTKWSHLAPFMEKENIEIAQDMYEDVKDMELMAGIWLEKPMKGGYLSMTTGAIMIKQFLHTIKSDRFWYERKATKNNPHAFTLAQLLQIRKSTIAGLICEAGNGVTSITQNAFKRVSEANPLVPCDEIPRINLDAWIDYSCSASSFDDDCSE